MTDRWMDSRWELVSQTLLVSDFTTSYRDSWTEPIVRFQEIKYRCPFVYEDSSPVCVCIVCMYIQMVLLLPKHYSMTMTYIGIYIVLGTVSHPETV